MEMSNYNDIIKITNTEKLDHHSEALPINELGTVLAIDVFRLFT